MANNQLADAGSRAATASSAFVDQSEVAEAAFRKLPQ